MVDLGELHSNDDVQIQVNKLKKEWDKQISRKRVSKNALFKAVLLSYKKEYFYIMFLNVLLSLLRMAAILIVHPLVDYVKTGQNAWASFMPFYVFPESSFLNGFTPEAQYGITLALLLILSQAISFILSENITFKQAFLGTKSTNALIGFVYEK